MNISIVLRHFGSIHFEMPYIHLKLWLSALLLTLLIWAAYRLLSQWLEALYPKDTKQ